MPPAPPITCTFDATLRRVTLHYGRQPNIEEWKEAVEQAFADPRYQPGYDFVIERLQVSTPPERAYIKAQLAYMQDVWRQRGATRWAIVVSDIASFGSGRMMEQTAEFPESVRVFKTLADADKWLADHAKRDEQTARG